MLTEPWTNNNDPPSHTHNALFLDAFTPRRIEWLEPDVCFSRECSLRAVLRTSSKSCAVPGFLMGARRRSRDGVDHSIEPAEAE